MAEISKRATSPRVGNTIGGGAVGVALAQIIVELLNKIGAQLTVEFQASLGVVLLAAMGFLAGWITRDKDQEKGG